MSVITMTLAISNRELIDNGIIWVSCQETSMTFVWKGHERSSDFDINVKNTLCSSDTLTNVNNFFFSHKIEFKDKPINYRYRHCVLLKPYVLISKKSPVKCLQLLVILPHPTQSLTILSLFNLRPNNGRYFLKPLSCKWELKSQYTRGNFWCRNFCSTGTINFCPIIDRNSCQMAQSKSCIL